MLSILFLNVQVLIISYPHSTNSHKVLIHFLELKKKKKEITTSNSFFIMWDTDKFIYFFKTLPKIFYPEHFFRFMLNNKIK